MIPAIGLIIGAYVITRMFELLLKEHAAMGMTTPASIFLKLVAFVTMLVTGFSLLLLITSGSDLPLLR